MKYTLTFSPSFEKHYRLFEEKQRKQIKKKLNLLVENPAHPSLRVKRIKGVSALWEMSVNMDIRIIWKYEGRTIILLLDVGHHDILKRY